MLINNGVVYVAGGIAILDSGVGGLTVVREVFRQLPYEEIIYIGDSARCPYGSRPTHEIYEFSLQMVRFLLHYQPKALVIACNTITAVLLQELSCYLTIPVIGVIEPGARAAIRVTKNHEIGVIGTQATIKSGSYERALLRTHPDLHIRSHACPNLVPLVESASYNDEHSLAIVERELLPLKNSGLDTLILGCTHYPIITDLISRSMGEGVNLISSAEETASELSLILARTGQLNETDQNPNHQFFTTGNPLAFQRIAENWLGTPTRVQHVLLDMNKRITRQ